METKNVIAEKEYIVYRCPDGSILLDWNQTAWESGFPCWPKHRCTELERGHCKGGRTISTVYAQMKQKYCNCNKTA